MKIGTDLKISATLKNLIPGVKYHAKIIVRDKQANGYENVPAVSFTTICTSKHLLHLIFLWYLKSKNVCFPPHHSICHYIHDLTVLLKLLLYTPYTQSNFTKKS
jgi:hypothetical protein